MQIGTKVYFKNIKDCIDNFSGTIVEELENQYVIENKGIKTYINKDRVTKNLKELLDIALD